MRFYRQGCGRIGEVFCECCKNYLLSSRQNFCPNCKQKIPAKTRPAKPQKFTSLCPNCKDLPPIYVVSSRDSILGALIHDYKYYSVRALARPLAELLAEALPDNLSEDAILVPLPTATHPRDRPCGRCCQGTLDS